MIRKLTPSLQGAFLSAMAFSLFSCGDAIVKHLSATWPLTIILFYTLVFILLYLAVFSSLLGGFRATRAGKNKKWHALRGFIGFFQTLAGMYAFAHLTLAKAYALLFSAPFITVLLARLMFREIIPPAKIAIIAAGFGGVLIVLRPGLIPVDTACFMALGSALLFSLSNLIARRMKGDRETLLGIALFPNAVEFIMVLPVIAMTGLSVPPLPDLLLCALLGALVTVGYSCVTIAFMRAPAAVAAPMHYIQILWAMLFGWLLFGDALDPWTGTGASIIIASGFLLLREKKAPLEVAAPLI